MEHDQLYGFSPPLAAVMRKKGIDLKLTRQILDRFNAGEYDRFQPVKATGIPRIDGERILDLTSPVLCKVELAQAQTRLQQWGFCYDLREFCRVEGKIGVFDEPALRHLGILLYPFVGYGILNGGSASSFFDLKRNKAFSPHLFALYEAEFSALAQTWRNRAKGLVPAYLNEDGTPGASFLELKMRSLLIESLRYQQLTGTKPEKLLPLFQMTSIYTHQELEEAYRLLRQSPYLHDLIIETGVEVTNPLTGVQPMLAAYTHSSYGRPKAVFTQAYGEENNPLPMPGGHGQNFAILRACYEELLAQGIRLVYLGNVDNLGYTVNPVTIALLALQGKEAGFEFAFRTVVDTKGGILVVDQHNRLNCADLGVAISPDEVAKVEEKGERILFNCATGLFNLEYLVTNLDRIIDNLPVRFSDQDKDAGRYSQAEQVTWEIIGMLNDFYIFGIDKYDRFLAAKLIMETLMASGLKLDDPRFPEEMDPEKDLKYTATKLHKGLQQKLSTVYGLKKVDGVWRPKPVAELKDEMQKDLSFPLFFSRYYIMFYPIPEQKLKKQPPIKRVVVLVSTGERGGTYAVR